MLSPSVIGYFALSVVVGVWPGARPAPRPCAPLLCSLTRVPATGPGALLETALVVPQVRQALAHAASHGSEERIKLGVLASWGGGWSRRPLGHSQPLTHSLITQSYSSFIEVFIAT